MTVTLKIMKIHSMRFTVCLLASLAALFVGCSSLSIGQTVLINDNFNNGTAGGTLGGTTIQTVFGPAVWTAAANRDGVFTADGKITNAWSSADPEKQIAGAVLPTTMGISVPSTHIGGIMTVSADIIMNTADWIGIGFLTQPAPSGDGWATNSSNVLSVFLKSNGRYSLVVNGSVTGTDNKTWGNSTFGNGTVAAAPSSAYTVELSLDMDTRKVLMSISDGTNKATILNWADVGLTEAQAQSIAATGFRIQSKANTSLAGTYSIDNFKLETSLTIVPEPGNTALFLTLAGGVMAGLFLRKSKKTSRLS